MEEASDLAGFEDVKAEKTLLAMSGCNNTCPRAAVRTVIASCSAVISLSEYRVIERRQDDNVGFGPTFLDCFGSGDSIHIGHTNIHEDHIRGCVLGTKAFYGSERGFTVAGHVHDLNIWL